MPGLLPLKVLILEDQPSDAELMVDELRQSGFAPEWVRVETKAEYLAHLNPSLDVILADHTLPQFNGLTALILLQERRLDIPFIIVSGSITEELAVSIMKQGAADYLLKDRMTRLGQSVIKVIADKKLRDQQHRAEAMLRESEARYRTLVEQASDGIFIANSEGHYIDVNAAGCQMLGYSRAEILGMTMRDLTRVSSDQPLRFEELRQGKSLISNREMIHRDGTLVPVEISAKQLSDGSFQGIVRDITERKRVENELRKLYTAVEQSGSSIIITDLHGSIEYVNPRFTAVTGYDADEVIGKNPRILKSGETSPEVYKQLWETIKAGGVWHGEFHNRNKNGELFWELASISSISDSEGNVVNFLAVKEDISEYKQAVEQLAVSENRYRRLFESSKDGILIIDAITGQAVDVNPYLCELLNYSAEEFLGKELWELGLFNDVIASQLAFRELQDKGYVRFENLPLETRDGRHIAVEFISNVYLVNDEKVIQCNIRDISQRKQAEELLAQERNLMRTLIDNLPDRIYAKDLNGRFTLKNQADMRQLGAASTDEMIGRTDFDYYPVDIAKQYTKDDQAVMSSGQALLNREEPVMDANGTGGWILTSKVPLRDVHGKVVGLVGIGRDITERKRAEEKLRRMNRTLAMLSDVNQTIVRTHITSKLFEDVCGIAIKQGGFRMAWVGSLDTETGHVIPVAHAGVTENYLEKLGIVLSDEQRGNGPAGTALNTGNHVIANDIEHDLRMIPWCEDALKLGYRATAVFPLKVANEVRGIFTLYAGTTEFFDDEELKLLDEMAADISFAMEFAEHEVQRLQAETALQQHVKAVEEMRLFLQTTLDAFPTNTVVLNPDGTIINVNTSWIRFADENGAPSEMHYLGANYLTVCDTSVGLWSEEAAPAAAGIRAVIAGSRDEFYLEYPCNSASENRWFIIGVTPFPGTSPRHVVITHINISERKQAEDMMKNSHEILEKRVIERTAELQTAKERVETILNSSTDAILLLHDDFTIQQTNGAFNAMFSCQQDDYFGKPLDMLLPANTGNPITHILQATAEHLQVSEDVEAQRKDGTVFTAELNIGIVNNDSFVCTFHDVSVRKEVEHSLKMAVQKEKELNELKTRFVSMASHEFRTPLASILAATETLTAYRHRLTDDEIGRKLSNIFEQVAFLKAIMDDVLQLARLQARRLEYNPSVLDLDVIWREMLDEFQNRPDITHHFLYTCESILPAVQIDKKLMRQIISNLLSNAMKYSPPEQVITIKLIHADGGVAFSVKDSGIGIPSDDLPHLFEPFHRASNVGTIHGTGLGLVITKEAVDLHGGTITVESQIDKGSTFTVLIPILDQEG